MRNQCAVRMVIVGRAILAFGLNTLLSRKITELTHNSNEGTFYFIYFMSGVLTISTVITDLVAYMDGREPNLIPNLSPIQSKLLLRDIAFFSLQFFTATFCRNFLDCEPTKQLCINSPTNLFVRVTLMSCIIITLITRTAELKINYAP